MPGTSPFDEVGSDCFLTVASATRCAKPSFSGNLHIGDVDAPHLLDRLSVDVEEQLMSFVDCQMAHLPHSASAAYANGGTTVPDSEALGGPFRYAGELCLTGAQRDDLLGRRSVLDQVAAVHAQPATRRTAGD